MSQLSETVHMPTDGAPVAMHEPSAGSFMRSAIIALTAFLTVVDLFATQAILPSLARHYGVTAGAMGFAVNASTMGMAVGGLGVAFFSRQLDRRLGILVALFLLAIPTTLLASAPNLTVFTLLRIAQGVCMASAFTLTLAYLGEHTSPADTASAYLRGSCGSFRISEQLLFLCRPESCRGGARVFHGGKGAADALSWLLRGLTVCGLSMHFQNPQLRASFGIAFCILFAFIGTFTYVNFVLVQSPLMIGAMALGFVYFVFLPSIVTTPLAGRAVSRLGTRPTMWGSLAIATVGLPFLLTPTLPAVLTGMVLLGVGTFFAQATATGFVGRAATSDRGSASGIYLACYFLGGLVGSAVLGQLFDHVGWHATIAGIGSSLILAAILAIKLRS